MFLNGVHCMFLKKQHFICRMQKQGRNPALPSEAGRKRIHSTEQHCFQHGVITPDFVWKRGHI